MRIELFLSLRFLRESRQQTGLIVVGVAVGVGVIVFLSALISGLQANLIAKTVGSQPHVVVQPAEEAARPLVPPGADTAILRRVEPIARRLRALDGWQQLLRRLDQRADVRAAAPVVRGPAIARRGGAATNVQLVGIDPARYPKIIDLEHKLRRGVWTLVGRDAIVGSGLARDLGIDVGDTLRLETADGSSELLEIRGVFELGAKTADDSWVLVSLRTGQSLLDLPGGATAIEVALVEIYDAETFAAELRAETGLDVDSWMASNAELLTALRSQSASSWMIQIFVLLAVAIGIASVLVVSVVQRSREIGILRAMGTPRVTVQRAFLLQGGLISLLGSLAGSGFGAALAVFFRRVAVGPDGTPLFPIVLRPQLFLIASAVATASGLIAALFPARRAARLDPVAAIRYD